MNPKETSASARSTTRFHKKPSLKDEFRSVVAKLQEESERLLERDFPREEWTQTQFFHAIKKTCKELRQGGAAAAPAPATAPKHLQLEDLVGHLEAERAELRRHVQVLEIVRDQLWELLMQNRKELDQAAAQMKRSVRTLEFYADASNWLADRLPVPRVGLDGGERARAALAKVDRRFVAED